MKVTIGCLGRRYDVDLFVAIALALRDRGHTITIAGSADALTSIEEWRFDAREISPDVYQLLESPQIERAFRRGNFGAAFRLVAHNAHDVRHVLRSGLIQACADADVVVMPATLVAESLTLEEALHKPVVIVATTPSLPPSSHVPQPFIARKPLPLPLLNRVTHTLFDRQISSGFRRSDDVEWRTLLGLKSQRRGFISEALRRRIPQLHAHSSTLYPRPPDWPAFVESVGRIAITPARKFAAGWGGLPRELAHWLDSGPAPVAMVWCDSALGNGAAAGHAAQRLTRLLRVRVVVSSRYPAADVMYADQNIYLTGDVDHEQLFRRARAAIHDGGAGVTATAVGAGIPTLLCSAGGDRAMWGERLRALGIGNYLALSKFDLDGLAAALKRIDTKSVRQRAHDIGSQVHAENGIPAAIARIERIFHEDDGRSGRRSRSASAR